MKFDRRSFAVALGCALAAGALQAQPEEKKAAPPPQASVEEKAMMEAFQKMGAVGPNHELLKGMAGEWSTTVKLWMQPGQPPMESSGTSVNTPIMGGRYVRQDYKGDFMGRPFEGVGYVGYDNLTGKFFSTWIDSMSTGFYMAEGAYDAGSKTFTYRGELTDPMNPATKVPVRQLVKVLGDDTHVFEWYETRGGQEARTMEITYTRKK